MDSKDCWCHLGHGSPKMAYKGRNLVLLCAWVAMLAEAQKIPASLPEGTLELYPSVFHPKENIVISTDLNVAFERNSVYSFTNLTSLSGMLVNSSIDCNEQCQRHASCNLWSYCNQPQGCKASTANVSWVDALPEWLSPPPVIKLDYRHCVLQYAPETTQVGKGNSFKWGNKGSERNISRKDVTIDTGAPILRNVSVLSPPVPGYIRYFGVDLPGHDFPCDYSSAFHFNRTTSLQSANIISDEDTDLDWEYCWLSGSAELLLRLCSEETICDGVSFFPNGYSRIGPLHYNPSGWLKSTSYTNTSIDFSNLAYNPAAVLYVKYSAALQSTPLAPEKLKADEVVLILSFEGVEPQVLNSIDMPTILMKALHPEVSARQVHRINSQAGLPPVQDALSRRGRPGRQLLSTANDQEHGVAATEAQFLVQMSNSSMVPKATYVMASEGFSAKVENELTALGHTGTHVATLYATGHEARPLPNQPQPPPPVRMTPAMPSLAVPLAGGSKHSGLNYRAVVGIAAGAFFALFLTAAATFVVFRSYKQKHARLRCQPSAGDPPMQGTLSKSQTSGSQTPGTPTNLREAEAGLVQSNGKLRSSFEAQAPRKLRVSRTPPTPSTSSGCEGGALSPRICIPDAMLGSTVSVASSRFSSASFGEVQPEDLEIVLNADGSKKLLGKGAYGEVYLARWRRHTLVAAKFVYEPSTQPHFWQEVQVLQNLRHPNIVTFLGASLQPGKVFLCTEYHAGGNLAVAMKKDRNREPRALGWYARGRKLALDVARGIAFLHANKIIMFDIKSTNVVLDRAGLVAKVCDFGLSKVMAGTHTQNTYRGTLPYMAPELCSYGQKITNAVDVYSFGVLLWEMVTYETPNKRVPMRPPRVPEECPQQIVDLYQACLHDDPASRPTMLDIVGHLEAANLAVRESFASNSSAGTPAAAAGRSNVDGGVSTPGSAPHLASSCESPSPIPRPSSAVTSHLPRPTSAVAKYDQAALADVPPSPFAVASYHPRPTSAVAKYDQAALANVPPSPFAAVVDSARAGVSEPQMQPIAGHSDTSSD
eukprot:jgi/Botrbrau1/2401/Bobra.0395s0030.1